MVLSCAGWYKSVSMHCPDLVDFDDGAIAAALSESSNVSFVYCSGRSAFGPSVEKAIESTCNSLKFSCWYSALVLDPVCVPADVSCVSEVLDEDSVC